MSRPAPSARDAYRWFCPITTRWHDNDLYGHVNNVIYYSYFDTVANTYLIKQGGLDIHHGDVVGFVVSSGCQYFAPVAFPDRLEGGLRVNQLGNSSVEYGLAIFVEGTEMAVAEGHFVHVFVNRATQRPVPIPERLRVPLQRLLIKTE